MSIRIASCCMVIGFAISASALAQAPAGAPAGSNGQCNDGSFSSHDTKKGACAGHKGVKAWFGAAAASAPAAKPMVTAAAPAPMVNPAAVSTAAPAAGGGVGRVWVNTASKTYHCSGTKYYGKTKRGEYMTEGAAKAAGNHADHGKACA